MYDLPGAVPYQPTCIPATDRVDPLLVYKSSVIPSAGRYVFHNPALNRPNVMYFFTLFPSLLICTPDGEIISHIPRAVISKPGISSKKQNENPATNTKSPVNAKRKLAPLKISVVLFIRRKQKEPVIVLHRCIPITGSWLSLTYTINSAPAAT